MDASKTFDASHYQSKLGAVQAKLESLQSVQEVIRKKDDELDALRKEKKEEVRKLLDNKKGLDLRSEAKKDREARTTYLREVGILLPTEEICKVRESRTEKS